MTETQDIEHLVSEMIESRKQQLRNRILEKIKPDSYCWIWQGAKMNSGYGKTRGLDGKDTSAHRLSYQVFCGDIPKDMCVLHKCDVRTCVNPMHLFLGTKKDNAIDMVQKGRQFSPARLRTKCPKGHNYSGMNIQGRRICAICQKESRLKHEQRKQNEHSTNTV